MKILVKFFAVDIPMELKAKELELPAGATVDDALEQCLKLPQIRIERDYFKASMVLKNGARAELSTPLSDGDVLSVLRTMEGG